MNPHTGARPSPGSVSGNWLLIAIIVGVALAIGLLVGVADPLNATVAFVAIAILAAGAKWPLYAALISLALLFEAIPIGGIVQLGSFRPHELLLAYIGLVVLARAVARRTPILGPLEEFKWPMLFLLACIVASLVYVLNFTQNRLLLAELRTLLIWTTLPILLLSINSIQDYRVLLRASLAIGLIIALFVTIQSLFNVRILYEARVEMLDNSVNADVTRSIAGGATYIIIFALYYVIMMPSQHRWPMPLRVLAAMLLVSGLAVSFGRGVWVATAAGLMVATYIAKGIKGVTVTALLGAATIIVVLSAAALYNPRLTEAIVDRATGIGEEVESGGSFGWRKLENRAAMIAIEDHPWTGVGLGGEYKKTISSEGSFATETSYIHNAYVAVAVKMGIHAALFPPLMILCFLIAARRTFQKADQDDRMMVASLTGAFLVPCITSYTQPEWVTDQGIAAFCLLISILLIVRRKLDPERNAISTPQDQPIGYPKPHDAPVQGHVQRSIQQYAQRQRPGVAP